MRLIFLEEKNKINELYYLPLDESKHLLVNRFKIGDSINAILQNNIGKFIIRKILNKIVYGEFKNENKIKPSDSKLVLIIGLPKDRALLPIIEKSSEIGVNSIFITSLYFSDRKELNNNQLSRLNKICKEGCKQSGNPIIPDIFFYSSLNNLLKNIDSIDGIKLVFDENTSYDNNLFNLINKNPVERFKNVVNFVGPEGGLSSQEKDLLFYHGFVPINLGKNVLRTETAAITTLFFIKTFQNTNFL